MPISLRKVLVDLSQTGFVTIDHIRIQDGIEKTFSKYGEFPIPNNPTITRKKFRRWILHLSDNSSWVSCSIIWMLCRCCPEMGVIESDDILKEGIIKELLASQEPFGLDKINDYSSFFYHHTPLDASLGYSPAAEQLARRFSINIHRAARNLSQSVLYPVVQRRKNMSGQTGLLYSMHYPDVRPSEVKSSDLEVHYYNTGERIQGQSELRWSWKFNDLKPRPYYCIGGRDYWPSRYIRKIAASFLDACPTSKLERRKDIALQFLDVAPDDYLTLWDYTSFTTSLSELRHFLFYLARFLESCEDLHKHTIKLVDFYNDEPIIHIPIWEILDHYNESINVFSDFSILRVLDILDMEDSPTSDLVQSNSGMLGIPGNIGFSTLLHAYHLEGQASMQGRDVMLCIGDDAFATTLDHPSHRLIPHMNRLGTIHQDKFEIFQPCREGDGPATWKFVKRGLTRDAYGVTMGILFNLPIFPLFFKNIPRNRTRLGHYEYQQACETMLHQVSSLLWAIHQQPEHCSESDLRLLRDYQFALYRSFPFGRLPFHGRFPGHLLNTRQHGKWMVRCCIPPVIGIDEFDPRKDDWSEWLWDHSPSLSITIPLIVESPVNPDQYSLHSCFRATAHPIFPFLEDFGILEEGKLIVEDLDVTDSGNRRTFLTWLKGRSRRYYLYEYRLRMAIPDRFVGLILHNGPAEPPDMEDEWGVYS